ncbi:N-acetylmuramoyl-L-alanine amidase family protein [Clostridium sp. JNZ J1-5]|nr:N-acetylmuramoyl-L-alanine amidase [Clostridium sp.]
MKIYVSPSSQTTNVGVGNYGTEAARMKQLSDLLIPKLKAKGYTVYGGDNSLTLTQRISASNANNVDYHVALHSNAGGGTGPETWYYTTSTGSKALGASILTKLKQVPGASTGRYNNGSTTYTELKDTVAIAVIVEVAFHDNINDVNWMLSHWDAIAQAIADGIAAA